MSGQGGVTLVELLVTLAIAVLLALLSPVWGQVVRDVQLSLATNGLAGAVRFARSRAVMGHERVTLCAGDAAGCDAHGRWARGCVAFLDADRDGQLAAGEDALRVWRLPRGPAVQATTAALVFDSNGIVAAPARWVLCWPGEDHRVRGLRLLATGATYPFEADSCAL